MPLMRLSGLDIANNESSRHNIIGNAGVAHQLFDFLAEQMVALNNSVRQLLATMTYAVSALERGATAADVEPSRLHLPLCTAEAYEDFVRRLSTEAELAERAFQGVPTDNLSCSQLSPPKHTNRQ
ncbi:hypothetical protein SprV_0702426400 [Sparganum proliferum]